MENVAYMSDCSEKTVKICENVCRLRDHNLCSPKSNKYHIFHRHNQSGVCIYLFSNIIHFNSFRNLQYTMPSTHVKAEMEFF